MLRRDESIVYATIGIIKYILPVVGTSSTACTVNGLYSSGNNYVGAMTGKGVTLVPLRVLRACVIV